jgi:hypothetical protein
MIDDFLNSDLRRTCPLLWGILAMLLIAFMLSFLLFYIFVWKPLEIGVRIFLIVVGLVFIVHTLGRISRIR